MDKVMGHKAVEIQRKKESLQEELLKIDSELFELEKKYGEFVTSRSSPSHSKSQKKEEEEDKVEEEEKEQIVYTPPEIESSHLDKEEPA